MKIGIVQFPGSTGEREVMLAVQRAGMEPTLCQWSEGRDKLRALDGYIIASGYSYDKGARSGVVAALDPVMVEIATQSEQGKPVLGIGHGAQVLVESGLVPGLENNKAAIALANNRQVVNGAVTDLGFYNAWVNVRVSDDYQRNAFTRYVTTKNILNMPVAGAEGRFVIPQGLLQEMMLQGLHVFQYCDEQGAIDAHFPVNPNGSIANVAAVSNKNGNVMAIVPHPERAASGDCIFDSMRDYIMSGRREQGLSLHYYPRQISRLNYQLPVSAQQYVLTSIIDDRHARSLQNTLQELGIKVNVERYAHWELHADASSIQQAKESGVLSGEYAEGEFAEIVPQAEECAVMLLVRDQDNSVGEQRLQQLRGQCDIQAIQDVKHGVLWRFSAEDGNINDIVSQIVNTRLIMHPCIHDCYDYRG